MNININTSISYQLKKSLGGLFKSQPKHTKHNKIHTNGKTKILQICYWKWKKVMSYILIVLTYMKSIHLPSLYTCICYPPLWILPLNRIPVSTPVIINIEIGLHIIRWLSETRFFMIQSYLLHAQYNYRRYISYT